MVNVTAFRNPLTADRSRTTVDHGRSYREILDDLELGRNVIIACDDRRITAERWDDIPRDGALVLIRVVPVGVGLLALPLIGIWAIAEIADNGKFDFSLRMSSKSKTGAAGIEQRPGLKGGSNSLNKWGPVPIVLGTHYVAPFYAGNPYTEISGTDGVDQYIHLSFIIGYGPLSVGTIRLGENLLATNVADVRTGAITVDGNYSADDVSIEIRYDANAMTYYPLRVVEDAFSMEMKSPSGAPTYLYRTTAPGATKIEVDFECPSGVTAYNDEGSEIGTDLEFKADYRVAGSGGAWTNFYDEVFSDKKLKATGRYTAHVDLAAGQYEVRAYRVTADSSDDKVRDDVYWTALRSSLAGPPVDSDLAPKVVRLSMKIKASSVINGSVGAVNCLASSIIPVYDGSGSGADDWASTAITANPAAQALYVLRGAINPRPVADGDIDWPAFEALYTWCETIVDDGAGGTEKRNQCHALVDSQEQGIDLLARILATARASITRYGNVISLIHDTTKTTHVALITPRNSWDYQGSKSFSDIPHGFRVGFINAAAGYQPDVCIVLRDGYVYDLYNDGTTRDAFGAAHTTAEHYEGTTHYILATEIESIERWGITSHSEAWREGRYEMAKLILRPEVHSVKQSVEAIAYQRGDLVRFGHDVPLFGVVGGMLKTVTLNGSSQATAFTGDELLTMEAAKTYGIRYQRVSDGRVLYADLTEVVGSAYGYAFSTPIAAADVPAAGDQFWFGETSEDTVEEIVVGIEPGDDLSATVYLQDYAAGVHTADTGTIPDFDSHITLPVSRNFSELGVDKSDVTTAVAVAAESAATAVAARSRTFATVALISAATGAYDNELAYCQQTASYWKSGVAGTAFVDTGAATPTTSGIVAGWPLDEVPDIPDSAAGTTYKNDTAWTGWAAYGANGTVSVAAGIMSFNHTGVNTFARITQAAAGGLTFRARVRLVSGTISDNYIRIHDYPNSDVAIPYTPSTDWTLIGGVLGATTVTSLGIFAGAYGSSNAYVLEVADFYVGTAAYTTPAVDNSGHGIHGTVNGCTPYYSPRGRCLTFDGVNDYVSFDVTKFTHTGAFVFSVFVEGKARSAAQYLVSRDTGGAGGRGIRCWLSAENLPSFLISPDGTANVSLAADAGSECTANCELTFAYKPSTYMRIYKDGALIKETTSSVPALAFYSASQLFQLGTLVGTLPFSGFMHSPILYSAELSDQDILSLGLGLRPSLPYRLVDWRLSNAASDGIITNAEKPGYREDWLKLYNSAELITTTPSAVASMADGELKQLATEATTHGIWTPTTGGTAAKAYYDAVEALRVAYFNGGTRGTGGIGFALSKFSDDVTISAMSPTLEARLNTLISTGEALRAAIVAASKASAISTAAAAVPTNTPHYKGRYAYAGRPTSGLIVDDTCTLYSTTAGERGIYKATNATTLAKQTAPTTEMIADAWADIMWIDNQVTDYGVPTDYTGTGVDFVDVLGANVAFMNKLFAQFIKVQTGGSFRAGDRFDETGALDDATKNGAYIGADGAFLLEGMELSVNEDRARFYRGAGVQRRALQISDESLDWLDTPDTTPASDEVLQARIGRLGVGPSILMDGEFDAGITLPWGAESVINEDSAYGEYVQLSDGELRIVYCSPVGSYLVERIWNGSAWGAESAINSASTQFPTGIQLTNGELRIAYRGAPNNYLIERVWNGSAWGAESIINAGDTYNPNYVQLSDGELRIVYRRPADWYIVERIWNGSTWGEESIINAVASQYPRYICLANGELRVAYTRNANYYLYERIWNGSTWGEEVLVNDYGSYMPTYIQLLNGELRIAYMTDEGGRKAVERIWNGSTWGEESTVVNSYVKSISYAQLTDGELRMAYTLHSNDNLCERRLQRYAQLGAGIIERGAVAATGNNTTADYIKFSDGTMIVHGITNALTNATLYAITYPATFIAAPTLITNPNVDSTSTSNPEWRHFGYNSTTTGFAVYGSSLKIQYMAIGRWK